MGVLCWTWRASFYSYGALGTDKYLPFTLNAGGYPADLEVVYPEKLFKGLVLVKWWLLAFPQYIGVGVFQGGWWLRYGGLVFILATFGAVVVLFKRKYPRDIFDFLMGMDRWSYRVAVYSSLATDQYRPFRLGE